MKNTKFFKKLYNFLFDYHFLSYLSVFIIIYGLFDVAEVYLSQNTKTIKADNKVICGTDAFPFCNISDDIQFRRFILLALDGVSYQYIQPLLDYFGKNIHIYTVYNTFNRYTLPVFRT